MPTRDLRLKLRANPDGRYEVVLESSPSVVLAQVSGHPAVLSDEERRLERLFRTGEIGPEELRQLGTGVARVALPEPVYRSLTTLWHAGRPPRRLHIDAAGSPVADLPWEALFLNGDSPGGFLVRDHACHVVRQAPAGAAHRPEVVHRLKILVASSNPGTAAFAPLPRQNDEAERLLRLSGPSVEVQHLQFATPEGLRQAILAHQPNVLHFIGHGTMRPLGPALVLSCGESRREAYFGVDDLVSALAQADIRLVVLSACDSATLALQLAGSGIPAVIAMQGAWRDATAPAFSSALYMGLIGGAGVESALDGARAQLRDDVDWCVPVLCLGTADTEILSLRPNGVAPSEREPRHNIPQDDKRFVGRTRELGALRRHLRDRGRRLVTIHAMGGIGKTTLARRLASELVFCYPDGVWCIDCENCRDRAEIVAAIAAVLDLELTAADPERTLLDALRRRQTLLVVDCFEALTEHATLFERILQECPSLQMLVTSRVLLGTANEVPYSLAPMSGPRGAIPSECIELFVEAAVRVSPEFALTTKNKRLVRSLCAALEGVPLAIVLAAGRLRHLTLEEILDQVRSAPLSLLQRRGNDRHAAWKRVIEDSLRLLPVAFRELLWCLSVFAGPFTAEDAAQVLGIDYMDAVNDLAELGDHSLLQSEQSGDVRRFKLLDTVNDYLVRQLQTEAMAERWSACRLRHARLFAARAVSIRELLGNGRSKEAVQILNRDLPNLRVAAGYCIRSGVADLLITFASSLGRALFEAGLWSDFASLVEAGLESARREGNVAAVCDLLGLRGAWHRRRGEEPEATRCWMERLDAARAAGDWFTCADCCTDLAWQAVETGALDKVRPYLAEALRFARRDGDPGLLATARAVRAEWEITRGDLAQARRQIERARNLLAGAKNPELVYYVLAASGRVYRALERLDAADEALLELLRLAHEAGRLVVAGNALVELATLWQLSGDEDNAAYAWTAASAIHGDLRSKQHRSVQTSLRQFESQCGIPARRTIAAARTLSADAAVHKLLAERAK